MSKTIEGSDGKNRCLWCAITPEFIIFHDFEWGFPLMMTIGYLRNYV